MVYPCDEIMMKAIQEGHLDLLGTLFERHSRKVFAQCYRMVGDRHTSDDLVQESFLRVLRYRKGFKGTARFSTWLYRIVANVCIDHLRAKSKEGTAVRELATEAADLEQVTPPDDDRVVVLREALERLAPEKRELLVMSQIRELGYAQLAEHCGISEGAVRVRVHRAVRELKSIVDSLRDGER